MLFPAYFDPEKFPAHFRSPEPGPFRTVPSFLVDTMLGDFPIRFDQARPGWQLLTLFREVTVSSTLSRKYRAANAVDEDISTWWSASGDAGEWLAVDMGGPVTVCAVQINFADQDAVAQGRLYDAYRYFAEVSEDGSEWRLVPDMDRRESTRDSPHDYTELVTPLTTRHFRITSTCVPGGARFSISDLRLFGTGSGDAPQMVVGTTATRNSKDRRIATVTWSPAGDAQYYVLRWGLRGGPLFHNLQIYGAATRTVIDSLSVDMVYSFVVDAVNAVGLTRGTVLATA